LKTGKYKIRNTSTREEKEVSLDEIPKCVK